MKGIPGVRAELNTNIKAHQPFGVFISVDPDVVGFTNEDLVAKLRDGDPSIWTRVQNDQLNLHVFGLGEGEAELVGNAIAAAVKG